MSNYVSLTPEPTTSADPNISTEANALALSRAALHTSRGGKLVALTVAEIVQYHDGDWATIVGPDAANPGVSIRQLAGHRGTIQQTVIVGTVPSESFPLVSVC